MSLPLAGDARGAEPRAVRDTADLWAEFHARLRGFVARRVRDAADTDDIVQKVFLRIHRGLGAVRDDDRIHAWLHQIARNVIADHYRSPSRSREIASGTMDEMEALPGAGVSADGADAEGLDQAAACLRPMIDRLPAAYRRALTLVELEGRSQTRTAALEGISVSGLKSRVQRGRAKLKQMLLACCREAVCPTAPAAEASCAPPRW